MNAITYTEPLACVAEYTLFRVRRAEQLLALLAEVEKDDEKAKEKYNHHIVECIYKELTYIKNEITPFVHIMLVLYFIPLIQHNNILDSIL